MEKFNLPARPKRRLGSASTTWPTAVDPLGITTMPPALTSAVTSKRTGSSALLVAELRDSISDRRMEVASWILSVRPVDCAISPSPASFSMITSALVNAASETGSERESDGTATFTQLSSPAEPRGTDVGHRHPIGRGHRGRDWFGRDAEGAGLRLNWAGHGERLDEGVGISGIPGL